MKKNLSLVSAILMTTFTVFLFMPIIFTVKYHKNITPGVGHAGLAWTKSANIFELNILLTILIIVLALSSIIVLVLQCLEYKNKKLNKLTFLPVATCLIFIIACVSRFLLTKPHGKPEGTATWGKYGFYEYVPNWGFYIIIALVLIAGIISFFIAIGKVNNNESAKITRVTKPLSNADELKKFKELLDSEVITQEEFDAKKKQLLGL